MQNDNIDFQNLKRIKHMNPMFERCAKAIPIPNIESNSSDFSNLKKNFSYVVLPKPVQINERIFECKFLCPIFNCNGQSFILTKGENLWDFYRAKKDNEIILTEQEIWVFTKQITQALLQLQSFGCNHTHLKEYAIYRQSSYSYQLMYHPQMKSMLNLSHSNQSFYWYDFYLSPEQLQLDDLQGFTLNSKQTVFSIGLLLLNVMNAQDFNRSVYSKKNYEVDWTIARSKLDASRRKYSDRLIDLVKNCLKQSAEQRYGFKEILNDAVIAINFQKSRNLQFRSKFDQLIMSRQKLADKRFSSRISSLDNKSPQRQQSKSQSPKSTSSHQQERKSQSKEIVRAREPLKKSKEKQVKKQLNKQVKTQVKKQVKRSNPTLQLEKNNFNSFDSPPKKWKVSPVNNNAKQYSIAKPQNILSKQNPIHEKQHQKNQSLQKKKKRAQNSKKNEDVINFERGTFGGQENSSKSSLSSSKFKNDIKIQIESNPTESLSGQCKEQLQHYKFDNFETVRMITFGEMRSEEVLNARESLDSLDSQIQIMDSSRKKEKQQQDERKKEKQRQNERKKEKQRQDENQKQKQSNTNKMNIPQLKLVQQMESSSLAEQPQGKGYSLQHLKECAAILAADKRLARIEASLESQSQKLTMDISHCLQPLDALKSSVTHNHGVYIEGNLYFGPFKNGRRNGFGLEIFPENQYYYGNFKDDLFHGEGFYFWNKNQYFLGLFENGKRTFGHLNSPKLHYFGQFLTNKKINGYGRAKFKNGQEYVGQWTDGRRSGIGKLTQITKDHFIGYWEKGKQAGYGEHFSDEYPQQGFRLKAFWKDKQIVSQVIVEYFNGDLYEGSLNEDMQKHGKGKFIFRKGDYFQGTFYNDNATHGQLVYKNGEKYIGCLKNMKRHGFGEYHYLDGTIKKGNWIQNVRVQKQIDLTP